jgi:signal transduction histidine kinase
MATADKDSAPPLAYWQGLFQLPRAIWVPILAMCAIAIGALFFNEWSVRRVASSAASMASLIAAEKELLELRARMVDAETSQRGYLLSGDPEYLEPYLQALPLIPALVARLRVLVGVDAEMLPGVNVLESLSNRKLAKMQETILLAERNLRSDAIAIVRTREARTLMDDFRIQADRLLEILDRREVQHLSETSRSTQLFRVAFSALGTLLLLMLIVAVRLLVKDYWLQEAARSEAVGEQQRLEQLVEERTAELSALTTHLLNIREEEKADLARDLHDELGGVLTAAKMDLAWLQGRASANDSEVRGKLEVLALGIDAAMDVKRRVVENLRPALLDHFGLPTALQDLFEETCQKAGIELATSIPSHFDPVPQNVAIALFRVAQESLTNTLRHANAKNVELALAMDRGALRLRITDDGVGINPSRLNGVQTHGLAGMRHRIEALNGTLLIGENKPRGTRVEVIVPGNPAL